MMIKSDRPAWGTWVKYHDPGHPIALDVIECLQPLATEIGTIP
ncbi:MAG: hypothetical protein AB4352_20845 [Hormoscilla sp.]